MGSEDKVNNQQTSFWGSVTSFAFALLVILSIRWILVEPYVIPSGSMKPSLLIHDHILVNKLAYGLRIPFTTQWLVRWSMPERGDVVVFQAVDEDYAMIKRVIGLPGDTLEYTADGVLKVNGEPVERQQLKVTGLQDQGGYYPVTVADLGAEFEDVQFFEESVGDDSYRTLLIKDHYRWNERPFKVPEGHIFMMGDNRDNSKDSRYWGPLPLDNLLGDAMFVWLSCDETLPFAPFLCNPLELRWRRFFHEIE